MALVNGGYLHCTDKEILVNSSLKVRKKNSYGPLKNSVEQSRVILALFCPFLTIFSKGYPVGVVKNRDCEVKS